MSAMSFFSCCSSLTRSLSSSRWAFSRALWCCGGSQVGQYSMVLTSTLKQTFLSLSAGVWRFPKAHSMIPLIASDLECDKVGEEVGEVGAPPKAVDGAVGRR
jgi:hypothetical protein